MNIRFILLTSISLMSVGSFAGSLSEIYCPGNHGYIKTGMTSSQVLTLCGQPNSVEQSKQPLMQQTPVTQLIYTNLNQGAIYPGLNKTYRMWSLPSGTTQISMTVSIINDQVSKIQINGESNNAMSICGKAIQIGDPVNSVYSACGSPSSTNQTYIKEPVSNSKAKPEVWTYTPGQYQYSFRLTFLNGILQSIDQ